MCYEFLDRGQVRVSRHVAGFRSRQAEHTEAASQRSEECRRSPQMPLADACLAVGYRVSQELSAMPGRGAA